jgi:hypothetical protein
MDWTTLRFVDALAMNVIKNMDMQNSKNNWAQAPIRANLVAWRLYGFSLLNIDTQNTTATLPKKPAKKYPTHCFVVSASVSL